MTIVPVGLYDHKKIRKVAQKLWSKLQYIHHTMFRDLRMKTSARLEIFLEFQDEFDVEDKHLERVGNLLSSIRQVNRPQLGRFMYRKSSESTAPIERLLTDDAANLSSGRRTDFRNLSACAKAGIIMKAEEAVMITDSHPYIGPMHQSYIKDLTRMQKIGAWSLPMNFRVKLRNSTKQRTGLQYGADPNLLRIPCGDLMQPFGDGARFLRSRSQTNNMFWLVNKSYDLAIQLNESYYALLGVLQQYGHAPTSGEMDINLQDYNLRYPPTKGANLFRGNFFGEVNYAYIANELSSYRRDQFMIRICLLVEEIHYLLGLLV
jgi:hypothetical protein